MGEEEFKEVVYMECDNCGNADWYEKKRIPDDGEMDCTFCQDGVMSIDEETTDTFTEPKKSSSSLEIRG